MNDYRITASGFREALSGYFSIRAILMQKNIDPVKRPPKTLRLLASQKKSLKSEQASYCR